jgi:hypothetical protein
MRLSNLRRSFNASRLVAEITSRVLRAATGSVSTICDPVPASSAIVWIERAMMVLSSSAMRSRSVAMTSSACRDRASTALSR